MAITKKFNTIVVGLGAMGSAALYQLAKRNINVLGIDRLSPPHTLGSTHGDTRITRQAIGEGDYYSPLSIRSYELFREVERQTSATILEVTGGLIISSDSKESSINNQLHFFDNTLAAAARHNVRYEVLNAGEIRKRFPQFNVADDEIGYYEYDAAFLRPERAVQAHLQLAKFLGAQLHTNEVVIGFDETDTGVSVRTNIDAYHADHLILSVGPWLPQCVPSLKKHFKINRQVLYWFDISQTYEEFLPGRFPIFIWEIQRQKHGIYGFPAVDGPTGGVKIATEQYDDDVTPESVDRSVSVEEINEMYNLRVAPFFPQIGRKCIKSAVCLYTVTPDSDFVVDWLPASKRVVVCSPCSGHGFKHSAAIGECIAQMVEKGESDLDISHFKLSRLLGR